MESAQLFRGMRKVFTDKEMTRIGEVFGFDYDKLQYVSNLSDAMLGYSLEAVKKNPYIIAETVRRVPFAKVDELAFSMGGYTFESPERIEFMVKRALRDSCNAEGHTYITYQKLSTEVRKFFTQNTPGKPLYDQVLVAGLRQAMANGGVVKDEGRYFFRAIYDAERGIVENVKRLIGYKKGGKLLQGNQKAEELDLSGHDVEYSPEQIEAIQNTFLSKFSVITGGAGTGKTTVLKGIIREIKKRDPRVRIRLVAPTGKAAQRMTSSTGYEASTIHRFLYSITADTEIDYLFVDESSMINVSLMIWLLNSIPHGCTVVLLGDVNQLPAIGAGNVLHDLIKIGTQKKVFPVTYLKTVKRQGEGSNIIAVGESILKGVMPEFGGDCVFDECVNDEQVADRGRTAFKTMVKQGLELMDFQIIVPQRKGPFGTAQLNKELQDIFNPMTMSALSTNAFRQGDKVMQTENNYDKWVFNGEMGIVTFADKYGREVVVQFESGEEHKYVGEEIYQLDLAYASTVHKYQGSQCDHIVSLLYTAHHYMHNRNLFYTADTRAVQFSRTIGTRKALQDSLARRASLRLTALFEFWDRFEYEVEEGRESITITGEDEVTHLPKCFIILGFTAMPENEDEIKEKWRIKIKYAHPDAGGSPKDFIMFQQAKEQAIDYLNSRTA